MQPLNMLQTQAQFTGRFFVKTCWRPTHQTDPHHYPKRTRAVLLLCHAESRRTNKLDDNFSVCAQLCGNTECTRIWLLLVRTLRGE